MSEASHWWERRPEAAGALGALGMGLLFGTGFDPLGWQWMSLIALVGFFPVDEDDPAGSSGEVLILEVTDLDEEGQPCEFELLDDEEIAAQIYDEFREATKDLYDFE